MQPIPAHVQQFLEEIIRKYANGERNERFALWAAVKSSFILEYLGLLP